jgi:hypothetical protein
MYVVLKAWMTGETRQVPLCNIKSFGKLNRYGDNRSWTVAELHDGSHWYSLYRDQTSEVSRVMKTRLRDVVAFRSSDSRFDVFAWEPASGCVACDAGVPLTRDGRHHSGFRYKRFYTCRRQQERTLTTKDPIAQ